MILQTYLLIVIVVLLIAVIIGLIMVLYKAASLTRNAVTNLRDANNLLSLPLPYKKYTYFLNPSEKVFLHVLEQIDFIKNDYYILPQLHLDKIIFVPEEIPDRWVFINEMERKSVDFTLFDKNSLQPQLVIELDGPSHEDSERIERDVFVDKALTSAGINIIHQKRQDEGYNISKLSQHISSRLPTDKVIK